MVVNQVGNVYRSVRSERFVIGSAAVTSCMRQVLGELMLLSSESRISRSILDSVVFASCNSHKSIESSHIVGALWG